MENRAKNIGFKAFVIHLDKELVWTQVQPGLSPELQNQLFFNFAKTYDTDINTAMESL